MAVSIRSLVFLAGLASATGVWAQTQTPAAQKPAQSAPDMGVEKTHYSLDAMRSADVLLEPTVAEKREADQKGKAVDRDKGKVKDLVIATHDGQISGAAISVGGMLGIGDKVVFVPTSNLHWNTTHKEPMWVLKMTEADLKALPAFDVDKADKDGLDRIVDARKDMPADATKTANMPRYVLASKLEGCKTAATDKELGKVADATVNSRNNVDYLVLSVGGVAGIGDKHVLVPYSAFAWTKDGDKCVLKLNKTSDDLKNAPDYRKPSDVVATPDQMKKADEYFGAKSPTRAD